MIHLKKLSLFFAIVACAAIHASAPWNNTALNPTAQQYIPSITEQASSIHNIKGDVVEMKADIKEIKAGLEILRREVIFNNEEMKNSLAFIVTILQQSSKPMGYYYPTQTTMSPSQNNNFMQNHSAFDYNPTTSRNTWKYERSDIAIPSSSMDFPSIFNNTAISKPMSYYQFNSNFTEELTADNSYCVQTRDPLTHEPKITRVGSLAEVMRMHAEADALRMQSEQALKQSNLKTQQSDFTEKVEESSNDNSSLTTSDSCVPELRMTTESWKALEEADNARALQVQNDFKKANTRIIWGRKK